MTELVTYLDIFFHRCFGEEYPEEYSHYKSEGRKDIPCFLPANPHFCSRLFNLRQMFRRDIAPVNMSLRIPYHTQCSFIRFVNQRYGLIDNRLRSLGTDGGTKTICHNHEKTLCGRTLLRLGLLIHVQRAGYIEEIKGKAVHHATKHEK